MRIKMKVAISGARNGTRWPRRGETISLPDEEAKQLCASGMATPVAKREPVETATVPQDVETREGAPAKRGPGRPRKTD